MAAKKKKQKSKKRLKKKTTNKEPKKSKKQSSNKNKVTWNTARSDDGSIQITYTIPYEIIKESQEKAAKDLGENIDVPGFRKGKAPLEKLIEHIPDNTLLEKTLSFILPQALGETIREEDLELAVYPKFELVKAKEGEDWQVRANTATMPDVKLGDYKEEILGEARAKAIWTPDKQKQQSKDKKPSREELEQEVIKILLEKTDIKIPRMLIEDEVNARLSKLIERLEKMGLDLDSYLQSIAKTASKLREEYEQQAVNALALDLILNKIAEKEKVEVDDKQVEEAMQLAGQQESEDPAETEQRKMMVKSVLVRREALNKLVSSIM